MSAIQQAFIAALGTWFVTAAGAAVVVFTKNPSRRFLDASLGFAAGVMIAASCWSLLVPSIEMSEVQLGGLKWLPPLLGFLAGAVVMRLADWVLPHLHPDLQKAEGIKTQWHRSTLLVSAITLHNIPEGLAIGVAFGAAEATGGPIGPAVALAVGIGLQNFPEGTAVALPLRQAGSSRRRAFWYGQLSAVVEPLAAVAGAFLVLSMTVILPYALAFAAGAMLFVVVEELIPEAHRGGHVDLATMSALLGFAVMMTLDVALG